MAYHRPASLAGMPTLSPPTRAFFKIISSPYARAGSPSTEVKLPDDSIKHLQDGEYSSAVYRNGGSSFSPSFPLFFRNCPPDKEASSTESVLVLE